MVLDHGVKTSKVNAEATIQLKMPKKKLGEKKKTYL
jgi:hypothetical protein